MKIRKVSKIKKRNLHIPFLLIVEYTNFLNRNLEEFKYAEWKLEKPIHPRHATIHEHRQPPLRGLRELVPGPLRTSTSLELGSLI